MPTPEPRHAITETPGVARALDVARRRWPDQPPSRLLTRLIEVGAQTLEAREREQAVAELAALSPYYPPGCLDELRDGWSQ